MLPPDLKKKKKKSLASFGQPVMALGWIATCVMFVHQVLAVLWYFADQDWFQQLCISIKFQLISGTLQIRIGPKLLKP